MSDPFSQKQLEALAIFAESEISGFATDHPLESLSFFAFAADYFNGFVSLCFDTSENSAIQSQYQSARLDQELKSLSRSSGDVVRFNLMRFRLRTLDHTATAAKFAYPAFATIQVKEWTEYFHDETIPADSDGRIIIFFSRLIDYLCNRGLFSRISTLVRIGFEFFDDELGLVVVKKRANPNS